MYSRRLWLALLLLLGTALATGYVAVRVIEARRFRAGLEHAKKEMAAGRYHTARKSLLELRASKSGDGEVEYQLGFCELRRGGREAAVAAWEQVPPSSPFASRTAVQLAMVSMDAGNFTGAEEILLAARRRETGADSLGLLKTLGYLYQIEGRTDDLRWSIAESWSWSDSPAALLRQLCQLDTLPPPVETIRQSLERTSSLDDRVLLGRANLSTRTGQLDKALRLLEACLKRRPDDPVVWRARFELAQAAGDKVAAWRALEHLPARGISDVETARIRAWLGGREGDIPAERAALLSLIQLDPGNAGALDRLATRAATAGAEKDVAKIRSTRAEVTAARERYRFLLGEDAIFGDPAELAQLARVLGRTVEARGWALLRDGTVGQPGPTRPALVQDDRTPAPGSPDDRRFRTVAELCADLRPHSMQQRAAGRSEAPPKFVELAESAGLRFTQDNGASSLKRLPETMSGGVALLDFDGDGWTDVFAVKGGPLPPTADATCGDRLFRNRGNGTFEDASDRAGMARLPGGYGHGVAVGDYDNDGRTDLFVTRWRSYMLLHNRGDGTLEDVTAASGLAGERDWPTSAAWADLDGDGDLDLYVCHYAAFDLNKPRVCRAPKSAIIQYCSPREFEALPDHVFRNDRGRFVDITREAGFVDLHGRGLGVLAAHLDDDDRIDLYVANDMSANYLFRNSGNFHFEETALLAGAAANSSGGFQSGMGVACGDLDGDGRPDLAVTNYYGESTTFFRNLSRGLFSDDTAAIGLTAPTRCLLGFGVAFLDANNDGWLDLISANGHVNDYRPVFPWRMPTSCSWARKMDD
jgi:enediyne biosynthesis protein E4